MVIGNEDIARALSTIGYGTACDDETAARIAEEIADDPERLQAVARRIRGETEPFAIGTAVPDHSQNGEFGLLLRELVRTGTRHGIVVDAGAKGRNGSNSYDLARSFGWRAVLIEVLPARVAQLAMDFEGTDHRIFNCAVDVEPGRKPLYLGAGSFIVSLQEAMAASFGGAGEAMEVEARTLGSILDEAAVPADFDVLSIDLEGVDLPVLNQLIAETAYRPRFLIVEANHEFRKPLPELGFSPALLADYREVARTLPNVILAHAR